MEEGFLKIQSKKDSFFSVSDTILQARDKVR